MRYVVPGAINTLGGACLTMCGLLMVAGGCNKWEKGYRPQGRELVVRVTFIIVEVVLFVIGLIYDDMNAESGVWV